jgi:hypothetical protein
LPEWEGAGLPVDRGAADLSEFVLGALDRAAQRSG